MIIEGQDKLLVATIVSASNGVPVISGTMYALITLESDDSDNLKFWDANDLTWQTSPVTWPTGSHIKGGIWEYYLSGSATDGKGGDSIHYTYIDDTDNELSASVVSNGGEHFIRKGMPLTSSDIFNLVWDEVISGHQAAGSAGRLLSDASGNLGDIADSVWDEVISGHQAAGVAGKILSDASGSLSQISASIWNAATSDHQTAGSMGELMVSVSSSVAVDLSGSVVRVYESEPE